MSRAMEHPLGKVAYKHHRMPGVPQLGNTEIVEIERVDGGRRNNLIRFWAAVTLMSLIISSVVTGSMVVLAR